MSKSLGNGIDPLEIIEKYGADALRFALATGNSPGNDMRFSDEKIEAARNFANKLWNASRFVRMNLTIDKVELPAFDKLADEDKWILTRFNETVKSVNDNLDSFEVGVALSTIYDFTWNVFCDWYIELCKTRFAEEGTEANKTAQNVICYVLLGTLKMLHPFMPFITEEIWQALPNDCESIMIAEFPEYKPELTFDAECDRMNRVIDAIRAVRARRNEMNVPPSKKAKCFIVTKYTDAFGESAHPFLMKLASVSEVALVEEAPENADSFVRIVTDSASLYLPLADVIDFEKEIARLEGDKKKVLGEIERLEKKLSNAGFVAKAPAAVVEGEKAKLAKYKENLAGVEKALADLKK
jgi:valyl-tRNA synthetase